MGGLTLPGDVFHAQSELQPAPYPMCGRANFDPDNLVSVDKFRRLLALAPNIPGYPCWECASIVG